MTTLGAATQQPFAAVPGGVLCRDPANGAVIGEQSVSPSAVEDEHRAVVGAQACDFKNEPAKSALQ